MVDLEATLRSSLDGRYAIEGEVGRGGMSVVFRARDLKHNRTVAIKVLKPELSEQVGADRFHREVEFAANLTNPRVFAWLSARPGWPGRRPPRAGDATRLGERPPTM